MLIPFRRFLALHFRHQSCIQKTTWQIVFFSSETSLTCTKTFKDSPFPCAVSPKKVTVHIPDPSYPHRSTSEQNFWSRMDAYSTYRRCTLHSKRLAAIYWILSGSLALYVPRTADLLFFVVCFESQSILVFLYVLWSTIAVLFICWPATWVFMTVFSPQKEFKTG